MALMAVEYKEAIGSNCTVLCMLIKMLKPGKSKLICCPAVLAHGDSPITWEVVIFIPSGEVILPRENDKWWDNPALRVDALDHCYPFTIAWLGDLQTITRFCAGNNFCSRNNAHKEA